MDYDNSDTGVLFKNDKKGNEKAPDYKGKIYTEDGVERQLAAWISKAKSGQSYMSLKVQDKYEAPNKAPEKKFDSNTFDDDIPF